MIMTDKLQNKPLSRNKPGEKVKGENILILHNDDIHSFEYVIENLVDICEHTPEQAEQCALMTHYKGLCDVKRGKKNILKEMRLGLIKKGLKATID